MRLTTRVLAPALLALGSALAAHTAQAQFTVYGVTGGSGAQQLVRFSTSDPTAVTTLGATGATLTGVDFRPANGLLYGYNGASLFTLNLATGAATSVATVSSATAVTAAFDFNPMADRARIVDTLGTNLRVNPDNGVAVVDGPYTYAAGDVATGAPVFTEVAYTNSVAGASSTALFGLDVTRGSLVRITTPNGGTVNTVGSLGLGSNVIVGGFDIVTVGSMNMGFFSTLGANSLSNFYAVDLNTGAATLVGRVNAAGGLRAFAIAPAASTVPEPGTLGLLAGGLVLGGAVLRRRRAAA